MVTTTRYRGTGARSQFEPSAKSPAYDPNREALYNMENRALCGLVSSRWPRARIRTIIRKLNKALGVSDPRIVYTQLPYSGEYVPDTRTIRLTTLSKGGGRSPLVVLHEYTHYVMDNWDPEDRLEPHGPEFVGVYGDIMAITGMVPFKGFRHICKQYGVRIMDTTRLTTIPALRKAVQRRARRAK